MYFKFYLLNIIFLKRREEKKEELKLPFSFFLKRERKKKDVYCYKTLPFLAFSYYTITQY